jgi:toxin ParE1/3/4
MTPVSILREAEIELWEAVDYYECKAHGLGMDFHAEIERGLLVISEQPERWQLRVDGTRRYLVHRFPYLIVYTCTTATVWILAFAHCKRRPAYWLDR